MSAATQLKPPVKKPAHVADSLVYDFDMYFDPEYLAEPQAKIIKMLESVPPVFWTPRNGGHWVFLSHQANFDAARDVVSFSNEVVPYSKIKVAQTVFKILGKIGLGKGHLPMPFPIMLDPPMHTKYRKPLQRAFGPANIRTLEPGIRELCGELIDSVLAQGGCEFMESIAEPLPVKVFLQMLGMSPDNFLEYRALLKEHMNNGKTEANPRKRMETLRKISAAMRPTMLKLKENPGDDMISELWQSEIDGRPITLEEMENYGVLLFIAGLDTVMQSLGFAVRHLAADTALQQRLRDDPSLINDAVEEILRRYTFTVPVRRVTKDVEFMGARMKANDHAVLLLPGADLDPKYFDKPTEVNIEREGKPHIAFNAGPHRCLGSHLARLELRILYEEFLKRVPPFRLDPDKPPVFECGHVVGFERLNLLWDKPAA